MKAVKPATIRFLPWYLLVLCMVAPLLLPFAATGVSAQERLCEVTCLLVEDAKNSKELLSTAQKLIVVKQECPLDTLHIKESVDALDGCRLFEKVDVELQQNSVRFLLTPAAYIYDIRIRGAYPLFNDDIEKAMSTHAGDMFVQSNISMQDSLITALYRREGFIDPQVTVSSTPAPKSNGHLLHVQITPGSYFRVNRIVIKGNRFFSNARITMGLKIWRTSFFPGSAGRFLRSALDDDIKALAALYKSHRFADITIVDSTIIDTTNQSVGVILSVSEGNRYSISYSSLRDRGYWKSVLRKDIVLYKTGNRNNQGVRTSVKNIKKRMVEDGFLDGQITSSDTMVQHARYDEQRISLLIRRMQRTVVSSITIKGNAGLTEETIRGQMLHVDKGSDANRAYNPARLEEDVFALEMLYRSRGYLKATVSSSTLLEGTAVAITITIHEGPCTHLCAISVATPQGSTADYSDLLSVKVGDTYRLDLLKRDAQSIQAAIAEEGYPHVVVSPEVTMSPDSSCTAVMFRITRGPRVIMGDIDYVGIHRTRNRVLNREVMTTTGEPLSLRKIVSTQKGFRDLGLFNAVRFRTIGLQEKRDTVHVFIELAEKRPYYGNVGGGYQSDDGVFIDGKAGDRNVFGRNKEMWVGAKLSMGIDSTGGDRDKNLRLTGQRGEIGLLEPRFLGTHIRSITELYAEKSSKRNQSWGKTEYGISSGLIRPVGTHALLGLGSKYERCQLFFRDGAGALDTNELLSDERPRNIITITPSYSWDNRDSFTRPRKGAVLSSSIDISKGIDHSRDNVIKIEGEAKGYISPLPPLTIASVIRAGYLYSYSKAVTIPADKHFYLGGTGDVRGFGENLFHPAGSGRGTTMLFGSVEGRMDIGFNIELALFFDVGRLENSVSALSADQFKESIGTGVRYITPIGPIGILYGRQVKSVRDAFHFSLGYTF